MTVILSHHYFDKLGVIIINITEQPIGSTVHYKINEFQIQGRIQLRKNSVCT